MRNGGSVKSRRLVAVALKELRRDLPGILKAVTADARTTKAIEDSLTAAYFNGAGGGAVQKHFAGK